MKNPLLSTALGLLLAGSYNSNAQLPTGYTTIDINNIEAGITSSSDLFWNFMFCYGSDSDPPDE